MAIIIWGLSTCLGSFVIGWLIHYTSNYVIVMSIVGLGALGATVFLLAWERVPSLEVICIVSAILGLCHGTIFSAAFGKCLCTLRMYFTSLTHLPGCTLVDLCI